MTHLSRRLIDPEKESFFTKLLTNTLTELNYSEMSSVINVLLSKTEVKMLKKRLAIIYLYEKGLKTTDICELTKTTLQTVIRILADWKHADNDSKRIILKRLNLVKLNRPSNKSNAQTSDWNFSDLFSKSGFQKKIRRAITG